MLKRLALVTLAIAAALPLRAQDESFGDKVRQLLQDGTDLYNRGKYAEANSKFEEAFQLKPSSDVVYAYIKRVGEDLVAGMMNSSDKTMQDVGRRLFELAKPGEPLREGKKTVLQYIEELKSDDYATWRNAFWHLKNFGPYAVRFVMPVLADQQQDKYRGRVILLLTEMGVDASHAVIEALDCKDPFVRQQAAIVLGNIKDDRAVPALKHAFENANEPPEVKKYADEALRKILRDKEPGDWKKATEYYYELAMKYYYSHPSVILAWQRNYLIWKWDAQKDVLTERQVARMLYNDQLAEEALYDLLTLDPDFRDEQTGFSAWSLMACVHFTQSIEARAAVESAVDALKRGEDIDRPGLIRMVRDIEGMSEASVKPLGDQITAAGSFPEVQTILAKYFDKQARVIRANVVAQLPGRAHLYEALARSLADGNYLVAKACIETIEEMGEPGDLPGEQAVARKKPKSEPKGSALKRARAELAAIMEERKQLASDTSENREKRLAELEKRESAVKKRLEAALAEALAALKQGEEIDRPALIRMLGEKDVDTENEPPQEKEEAAMEEETAEEEAPAEEGTAEEEGSAETETAEAYDAGAIGHPLIEALTNEDKRVRYAAAKAMVTLNPQEPKLGMELVIPNLIDAIGEQGVRVALVIYDIQDDADRNFVNGFRKLLNSVGVFAVFAPNGPEGIIQAKMFPTEDVIIIQRKIAPQIYFKEDAVRKPVVETVWDTLRDDIRTRNIPRFILSDNAAEDMEARKAYEQTAQGWITKDIPKLELQALLEKLFDLPEAKKDAKDRADEIARIAAETLASIDPATTLYPFLDAVDALCRTVSPEILREDFIRIPSARALGRYGDQRAIDVLAKVVADKDTDAERAARQVRVRVACAKAISQIFKKTDAAPTEDVYQVLLKYLRDGDYDVEFSCGEALGNAQITPPQRLRAAEVRRIERETVTAEDP